MIEHLEELFTRDTRAEFRQFGDSNRLELLTIGAIKMFHRFRARINRIERAAVEFEFSNQSSVNQFGEGAIDRRATGSRTASGLRQLGKELLGVEWALLSDDDLQDVVTLPRVAHAAALEEISEAFLK